MTISALKHISYAAAGGLTAGWLSGLGLAYAIGPKGAAAAYAHFSHMAAALMVTAAVGRAFDELLKASGWSHHAPLRLIASHAITLVAILPTVSVYVGYPVAAARLTATALTVGALAVNILVK